MRVGKIKTLAIGRLAAQFGLGDARWLRQFATGLPIAGVMSQKDTFALDKPDGEILGPDPPSVRMALVFAVNLALLGALPRKRPYRNEAFEITV